MARVIKYLFLNTQCGELVQVADGFALNAEARSRGDRILYVHQPESDVPLGLLICLDGDQEITTDPAAHVESTQDILVRLYAEKVHQKQLTVFIPAPQRMEDRVAEYACNPQFSTFIHNKLIPLLQKPLASGGSFACSAQREQITITGVSMSAVAAVHIALRYPETFGKVLVQSGAFWWYRGWENECSFDSKQLDAGAGKMEWLDENDFPHQPGYPIKFYMQAGTNEKGFDGFPTFESLHNSMAQKLVAKGHRVVNTIIEGGSHSCSFWQSHKERAFREMGFALVPDNEQDKLHAEINTCSAFQQSQQTEYQGKPDLSSYKDNQRLFHKHVATKSLPDETMHYHGRNSLYK